MSFKPVLDQVIFWNQDDGNTAVCVYVIPEDDKDVTFSSVYQDGDDYILQTADGEKYLVPPWHGPDFEIATQRPQQLFLPMDRDGNELLFYRAEFLSSPPAARFGV